MKHGTTITCQVNEFAADLFGDQRFPPRRGGRACRDHRRRGEAFRGDRPGQGGRGEPGEQLPPAPARDVLVKRPVADLVECPTLGATAKATRTNPLMDNYAGMAIIANAPGLTGLSLISDDNFNAMRTTRVLNLATRLP